MLIKILSFIFKGLDSHTQKDFWNMVWKLWKKKSEIVAFFKSRTEFLPLVMYSGVVTEAEPFQNFEIFGLCAKPLMNSNLYRMVRHSLREIQRSNTHQISLYIKSINIFLAWKLNEVSSLIVFSPCFLGGWLPKFSIWNLLAQHK